MASRRSLGAVALVLSMAVAGSGLAARQASATPAAQGPATARAASHPGHTCTAAFGAGTKDLTIPAGGVDRHAVIHVPATLTSARRPVPVVIAYHGYGGYANAMAFYTGLSIEADRQGFVAIYPQGLFTEWNFDGYPARSGAETKDLAFFLALMARLSASGCIDLSRVYLVGHSNGGGEAAFLACRFASQVAGLAVVAGTYFEPPCVPSRPVPVIAFHSLNDDVVPYVGGRLFGTGEAYPPVLPAEEEYHDWAIQDGCSGFAPASVTLPSGITRMSWFNCTTPVVLYRLLDGGHNWPGALHRPGSNQDINATKLMLQFFFAQPARPTT